MNFIAIFLLTVSVRFFIGSIISIIISSKNFKAISIKEKFWSINCWIEDIADFIEPLSIQPNLHTLDNALHKLPIRYPGIDSWLNKRFKILK